MRVKSEPSNECGLDPDKQSVVVITDKSMVDRLGGGLSLPLHLGLDPVGRTSDGSKLISLKCDLKIKRQLTSPYARSDSILETKSVADFSSGHTLPSASLRGRRWRRSAVRAAEPPSEDGGNGAD
ncbi:hypothetical protein Scep_015273 [Stephania cephalantha]|uniref:Uncharacterized protein n=1 Tax=Stephania cephalantha TaxID=152367 RepID=A0AAP0P085_9MAGN